MLQSCSCISNDTRKCTLVCCASHSITCYIQFPKVTALAGNSSATSCTVIVTQRHSLQQLLCDICGKSRNAAPGTAASVCYCAVTARQRQQYIQTQLDSFSRVHLCCRMACEHVVYHAPSVSAAAACCVRVRH
jgi:hypothetical protein